MIKSAESQFSRFSKVLKLKFDNCLALKLVLKSVFSECFFIDLLKTCREFIFVVK